MGSNVPKFASFRPKPRPEPYAKPSEAIDIVDNNPKPKTHSLGRSEANLPWPKQTSSTKTFFSDHRGDPQVLHFGSLNRYEVPSYHRYGKNRILGLSMREHIDRKHSTDGSIYTTPMERQRQERLLTKKYAIKSDGYLNPGLINRVPLEMSLNQDFISVAESEHQEGANDSSDANRTDQEFKHHVIEHDLRLYHSFKPDPQHESDDHIITTNSEAVKKNSELLRRTREHPQDLRNWLAFICHQRDMLGIDMLATELSGSDEARLADVRLAIIEEALRKIGPKQSDIEILYEELMKEAQKTWNDAKLTSKWKEVLSKHSNCLDLWFKYFDFEQSNFAKFRFEDCRSKFLRCLEDVFPKLGESDVYSALHLLLRLTTMMHEAGYAEVALAIWQAILEFHLMQPSAKDGTDVHDNLQAFSEFWESEMPRIGELGAKGWENTDVEKYLPPKSSSTLFESTSGTGLEHFENRELEAMKRLRYPGRSSCDEEDDAFHIIFFSDVESCLKVLPTHVPAASVMEAFLCFCDLPSLARTSSHQQAWRMDPFQRRKFHPSRRRHAASSFIESFKSYLDCPTNQFQMSSRLLFEQDFSLDQINLDADFLRRLLKTIAFGRSGDDSIREYLLAFELFHFPGEVQKTAKLLLKEHPSSLRLYNAYGLVESRRGNVSKSDQVFSMALSIQDAGTLLTTAGLELLSNWIWASLWKGELTEALWRMVSPNGRIVGRAAPETPPDRASLLHIQTLLGQTSESALLSQDYLLATLSVSLLTLSVYLTSNLDIAAAIAAHDNLTSWFQSHKLSTDPHAEIHAQAIVHLLSYHVTHARIAKPALLRTTLSPLISRFPENTLILALFAANETRSAIDDRVRRVIQQNALQNAESIGVAGWAFAIHHETLRGEIAGSTCHSIRALYKRATRSTSAHSPAFWKAYLQFEVTQAAQVFGKARQKESGNKEETRRWEARLKEAKQRIRDVFYAGLKNLPWCKDFIMMAFTSTCKVFEEEEELWKIYRVLQEKELRLYIDLNEEDA